MKPTLKHGNIVIAHRVRDFKVGQVVIAHVGDKEVVKRIIKIDSGRIYIEGDNKDSSTDSRHYGSVTDSKVEGVVFWPRV